MGLFLGNPEPLDSKFEQNFTAGIWKGIKLLMPLEGVVVGAVLVISLEFWGKYTTYTERETNHFPGGAFVWFCLLAVYAWFDPCPGAIQWSLAWVGPLLHCCNSVDGWGNLGGAFFVFWSGWPVSFTIRIIVGNSRLCKGTVQRFQKAYYIAALLSLRFMGYYDGQNQWVYYRYSISSSAFGVSVYCSNYCWCPAWEFGRRSWFWWWTTVASLAYPIFGMQSGIYLEPLFLPASSSRHHLRWGLLSILVF